MAKQGFSTPSGMAGLTRFSSDESSRIRIRPEHVIVLTIVVVLIVALLHIFGNSLFGVG